MKNKQELENKIIELEQKQENLKNNFKLVSKEFNEALKTMDLNIDKLKKLL